MATTDNNHQDYTSVVITPLDYRSVDAKIAEAQETFTAVFEGNVFYYYWGVNFFVVKDCSDYYLVEYDDNLSYFLVNGIEFRLKSTFKSVDQSYSADDYPTAWFTLYNTTNTYDVGGLPFSVVGGIIGGAIGALIPGNILSVVVGAVVGAAAGMYLNGQFPLDYKITVCYFKKYRIIELGPPLAIEYYERIAIYGGPANNLYQNTLYYNTRTWTEYSWEKSPIALIAYN